MWGRGITGNIVPINIHDARWWYSKHIVVIMINFLRHRWHECILAWHCKSQIALRTRFLRQGRGASSDSVKLDCKNTIQNAIDCIDRQIILAAIMDVYLPQYTEPIFQTPGNTIACWCRNTNRFTLSVETCRVSVSAIFNYRLQNSGSIGLIVETRRM